MKLRIHREKLMFRWITKNHELVVGFTRVRYGTCISCGRRIPAADSLCDQCFAEKKDVSKK